jgi:ligand-binding sensor domain-containing protein/two-component sensor histidine kinase
MKKRKFNTYLIYRIFGLLIYFFLSCKKQEKPAKVVVSQPKIVEANGFVVPQDSIQPPIVIPLHNEKVVKAGKPILISQNTEVFKITNLQKPSVVKPITHISGQNGFSLPQKIALLSKTIKAGTPEIIVAKAPIFKEQNDKNIAIFGLVHGLKNKNISKTLQDKLGNLWIATGFGGFSKYDGKTFSNYSETEGLLNNTVLDMMLDHEGNIWLATYDGAAMFDGENFVNYTKKEGLLDDIILKVYEDKKNNIWLVTEKGVSRIDAQKKNITHFTEKNGLIYNFASSILEDSKGDVWIGTNGHGVSVLHITNDANGEVFTFKNITANEGLVANGVSCFMEDKQHNIWIGTNNGLSKYTLNENLIQNFKSENGFPESIRAIFETKNGKLYFGSSNGVVVFDAPKFDTFSMMTAQDGLSDNSILSLFEDNAHNLWISTENGLSKFKPNNFEFVSFKNNPKMNMAYSFLEDKKGNFWLATNGGILNYVPNKTGNSGDYFLFTAKEGLSESPFGPLFEDSKGNIWIGAWGVGVIKYDLAKQTFSYYSEEQGLKSNGVVSILEDKKGDIWFGMLGDEKGGLSKFDGKTFTNYGMAQGIGTRDVFTIVQDKKQNFWIGSWGGGITKFEPSFNQGKGKFTHFNKTNGLSNDKIRPIKVDKNGAIWFGTIGGGLNKYEEGKDGKPATFTHYTKQNGLSSDDIRSILEDKNGDLWFGTMYGLSKLNNKVESENKLFKSYTIEEGFIGLGCYVNALTQTKDNRIWIGTFNKITVFDPSKIDNEIKINEVQLTDIKLFNEKTTWQKDTNYVLRNGVKVGDFNFTSLSKLYQIPLYLSLPFNNNFLTFDFVGIHTNTPQKVKYKYFLEGIDQDWSVVSGISEASYGNLPSGNYVFKVKAMNGEGHWSKELNYKFSIRPPWWLAWWAYLLYAITIFTSIYYFIQYRVISKLGKFKELEAMRIKISSNLHDDVGTILSGLAMQSQMMAITAVESQKKSLLELSDMSHDAMERMRDTVWAIDSRKDKYENLIDRMRAFTEKNFNLRNIKHTFLIELEDAKKFIDPEVRQNIYLIFKEAITNICKHSDAKNVNILVRQQKQALYLLVHDNGNEKQITNSDGTGLHNMKMRAKKIGAEIGVGFENGFKVELFANYTRKG